MIVATLEDEMTYKNFPREYKLIVARLAISQVPSSASETRKKLFEYLTKHE